jgi:hypothetical protein
MVIVAGEQQIPAGMTERKARAKAKAKARRDWRALLF